MADTQDIQRVQNLIARAELQEAARVIAALVSSAEADLRNAVILAQMELALVERATLLGIITWEEGKTVKYKVAYRMLEILTQIEYELEVRLKVVHKDLEKKILKCA